MSRRKEVTVRLGDDQYERLCLTALQLRISHNQAIREALEMWLEHKQPTGEVRRK